MEHYGNKAEVFIRFEPTTADHSIHVIGYGPEGRRHYRLQDAGLIPRHGVLDNEGLLSEVNHDTATLLHSRDFIQVFVDAAYAAGIRPSAEVADSDAMRAHLKDMRTIAFKALKIEG